MNRSKARFRRFWHRYQLPFIVFLTGAAVLIIEVVATRILSPYFGNTLYTVSSVLGVVLAALSVGYYLGGRLADKHPEKPLFFTIILLGGISVLCLQLLLQLWLPSIGYELSIVSGPLISSLLLFFLPGFLLGMLSPFAIKLQEKQLAGTGIGTIAGEMFFWSTMGSIAGSLSAGFLLVPFIGINLTVIGVGSFLCVLGALPLLLKRLHVAVVVKLFAVAAFLGIFTVSLVLAERQEVLYRADGIYEKLTITDYHKKGRPVRSFQQDRSSSSAMYLDSDELVYDYTKYYELYKNIKPNARRSLVIGGAAYSIPKALLADSPAMQVDVAEIEPSLEALAKKYFRLPETQRIKTHVVDGRRWLATSGITYDVIFSDVYYSLYSIPAHFTTKEFFETAKRQLSENGVFIANVIGELSLEHPSFTYSELKTFRSVFPNGYLFAVESPKSHLSQNLIFVGINGSACLDFSAPPLKQSTNEVLRSLASHETTVAEAALASYPLLTDNYAPVEYMMSKQLSKQ
ncbi:MAG TPA: fused MFS/spermidine synthase [Candidatus Saccharimonadales bacterium]